MIINALTGEPKLQSTTQVQQDLEFTATPIFMDEWDLLMLAVQERLRLIATAAPQHGDSGVSEPVQARVLECVQALQQLHGLLSHASPRPTSTEPS